ncbi:maleylpyruvate isomerase family mycothiol-dependent enzyme [Streptomyces sp. NPDC006733]|uniref:maleylpyruvate isomerase family mycothiol-dependent enzyme n=1 Tax=Streptomyces sp. NPDC006733 TaxID=3155460 RepID=UPI0034016EE1
MAWLEHEAYCTAIVEETARLRDTLRGSDPGAKVPTCPGWTLHELAAHVGQAHRWAETIVGTRAEKYLPESQVPDYEAPAGEKLDGWLAEGAERFAATLRESGPELPVWTWARPQQAGFWARRMVLETLVHRADAALATWSEYQAPAELAADAIDEWLEIVTDPLAVEQTPELAELRGHGQTLHLHATDSPEGLVAEWVIERGPESVTWRREHAKGDVALRAPLTDLLLAFYRRLPLDSERVQVLGDRELLDHWLARTAF